jgi:hypothetical protein
MIRKLTPNDTRRYPGIATEISECGMSAIVTEPLNAGDEVQLSFDLKPGRNIVVNAIVRNHRHFRHGFEFVGLSEQNRNEIRTLCASLRTYEGGLYWRHRLLQHTRWLIGSRLSQSESRAQASQRSCGLGTD